MYSLQATARPAALPARPAERCDGIWRSVPPGPLPLRYPSKKPLLRMRHLHRDVFHGGLQPGGQGRLLVRMHLCCTCLCCTCLRCSDFCPTHAISTRWTLRARGAVSGLGGAGEVLSRIREVTTTVRHPGPIRPFLPPPYPYPRPHTFPFGETDLIGGDACGGKIMPRGGPFLRRGPIKKVWDFPYAGGTISS